MRDREAPRDIARRQTFGLVFHQKPEYVEASALGQGGQGQNGVLFVHMSRLVDIANGRNIWLLTYGSRGPQPLLTLTLKAAVQKGPFGAHRRKANRTQGCMPPGASWGLRRRSVRRSHAPREQRSRFNRRRYCLVNETDPSPMRPWILPAAVVSPVLVMVIK